MKVLAATIAAVVLAACGGGDELTVEDYFAELDRVTCERFVRCEWFAGPEACFASSAFAGLNYPGTVAIAEGDGSIVFDADRARACLDFQETAGCRMFDDEEAAICGDVLVGTVEPGGACFVTEQCTGYCDADAATSCAVGTCRAWIPAGGTCLVQPGPDILPCDDGLYCNLDSGQCTPYRLTGERCTGTGAEVCAPGLVCTAAACRLAPGRGELCSTAAPCGEVGTYCDVITTRCETMVDVGDACEVQAACPIGSRCETGTCVADPPGAALGAPCATDGECDSTLCDMTTGVCVEPPVCGS